MKLTQKLLVLLITITMTLPGSFVQVFAEDEAVNGGAVVMSEKEDSGETEEIKEEAKDEVKDEHTTSPDTEAAGLGRADRPGAGDCSHTGCVQDAGD